MEHIKELSPKMRPYAWPVLLAMWVAPQLSRATETRQGAAFNRLSLWASGRSADLLESPRRWPVLSFWILIRRLDQRRGRIGGLHGGRAIYPFEQYH